MPADLSASPQHRTVDSPDPAAKAAPNAVPLDFASWGSRAAALIIDDLLTAMVFLGTQIPALVLFIGSAQWTETGDGALEFVSVSPWAITLHLIGLLLTIFFTLWNFGIRQGRRGQSLGKRAMKIRVVTAETQKNLGAFRGLARYFVHAALSPIAIVNYLWPIWDDRRRCLHDILLNSVVVRQV